MGWFDGLFGKKSPPPPPLSPRERRTSGLAVEVVDGGTELEPSRDQVGGIPANIGPDQWPRCEMCKTPMTFIALVGCGPDEALRYPERGSIALFLCNSDPADANELCITATGPGSAAFFVGEAPAPAMLDEGQRRAIIATQKQAYAYHRNRSAPYPTSFLLPAVRGFRARPALDTAFRTQRLVDSADVVIEIGAEPEWIQVPHELTCTCGLAMELVIQFDSFDDAINLGDAGRAYVFACVKRCGPRAFAMRWDCC